MRARRVLQITAQFGQAMRADIAVVGAPGVSRTRQLGSAAGVQRLLDRGNEPVRVQQVQLADMREHVLRTALRQSSQRIQGRDVEYRLMRRRERYRQALLTASKPSGEYAVQGFAPEGLRQMIVHSGRETGGTARTRHVCGEGDDRDTSSR